MKIVLVHYHLRPGGVTQVMRCQAAALREAGEEILVLCGEAPPRPEDWQGICIAIVPGLHYDCYCPTETNAEKLAQSILDAIHSHWPGRTGPPSGAVSADLVHVHNPLIRKNSLLTGALKILAKERPLLLQIHDLAEDFRPDVYTGEEYPIDCHYGVINSRDYNFLLEAGLKPGGLHLMPNEVQKPVVTPGLSKSRYTFPVRGIRRKNIGEALFLSVFLGNIAITQPPTTGQDMPIYNRWKKTAAELGLPVEFEAGLGSSFADVMGSARAVITTSVKEGFGFSFLEPWTVGLAVVGRRIDYVCRDFEEAGLKLDHLYSGLNIPSEIAEPEKLRKKTVEALSRVYAAFGFPLPLQIQKELDRVFNRDYLDFGIMDEEIQEKILRLVLKDKTIREGIKRANPFLANLGECDLAIGETNRQAALKAYSRKNTLVTILAAYKKTLSPISQQISRSRLLELYLDPGRLFLVGISPPDMEQKKQ